MEKMRVLKLREKLNKYFDVCSISRRFMINDNERSFVIPKILFEQLVDKVTDRQPAQVTYSEKPYKSWQPSILRKTGVEQETNELAPLIQQLTIWKHTRRF